VRRAPAEALLLVRAVLAVVPDLPALDASDRVGQGEWAGLGGADPGAVRDAVAKGDLAAACAALGRCGRAAALAALGLLGAALVGGLGVRLRRTP
jgi:hypothetical protein